MNDPGIKVDIYSPEAASITTYPVPGPKVWGGQAGGSPPTVPNPQPTSTKPATQPTQTVAPPSNGGTVPKYGQCGGQGWNGGTQCIDSTCTKVNDYYHQVCVENHDERR